MSEFSHINKDGNPKMVNVSEKATTKRIAIAQSIVVLNEEIMKHFSSNEIQSKKGPVFQTAIIAGTQAVKQTSNLIPLCHPLMINGCEFEINVINDIEIEIKCKVEIAGKTGVEMEALTGASIAALTIYDMCKAFTKEIKIIETKLLSKTGGKSDFGK